MPILCGFDTEDDSKGNATLFAFVTEDGSAIFNSRAKAINYLSVLGESVAKSGETLQLWATNLEYDLVNLFGENRIREVTLNFGKSYLVGASWRKIQFRDTVRHIPASVKELGRMVGLEKLEANFSSEEYCIRDAAITYRAAKFLVEVYGKYNVSPKQTLASTALKIWETSFWQKPIVRPNFEIWDSARMAYYGGRTEPFFIGEHKNIKAVDAASMFPWAMQTDIFPDFTVYSHLGPETKPKDIHPLGVYRVSVSVPDSVRIPLLPYRTDKGLIYPTGSFSGWYVGLELLAAIKYNSAKIQIHEGFDFPRVCDPFSAYVQEMYSNKEKSRDTKRLGYKLLLNACYGKFGQKGEKIRCLSTDKFILLPAGKAPLDYKIYCGLCIWTEDGTPPPWSNMIWPAIVTARARVRLYEEIIKIQKDGGLILYCDTDSVIYSGGKTEYPEKARAIGDFENRGIFRSILLMGKKEYGLETSGGDWEIHVKGVPAAERKRYLTTGKAEFNLPNRIRASARRGLQANVWMPRTKERKANFNSRRKDADGFLYPIHLQNAGSVECRKKSVMKKPRQIQRGRAGRK